MTKRLKNALVGVFMASFVMAGAAQAAPATPASQLSLRNMANVQIPAGARVGSKRKSESKLAGLGLLGLAGAAAVVAVGVVAVMQNDPSSP